MRLFCLLLVSFALWANFAFSGNAGDRLNSPVKIGQGKSANLQLLFDEGQGASSPAVVVTTSGGAVKVTNDGVHFASIPTITDTLASFTVPGGGTGDTSFTANALVVGNGTGALAIVANNGTATKEFLVQTSSGAPVYTTIIGNDLPLATAATQGAVSITTQTFAGAKTFNGELVGAANTTATTLAATVPSGDLSANTSNVNSLYFGSNSNNSFGVLASNATNDAYVGFGFYVDSSGSLRYSGTTHTSFMELLGGAILFKSDTGTPTQNSVVTPVSMLSLSTTTVTTNQSLDAAGGFTADSAAYATASVPGLVSTTTQTFAGAKTFSGNIAFSAGSVGIVGVTNASSASGGNVGEVEGGTVLRGSAVSLSTGVNHNVISCFTVSLGDWDVSTNTCFTGTATSITHLSADFNTSDTQAADAYYSGMSGSLNVSAGDMCVSLANVQLNISSNGTPYCWSSTASFSGGTVSVYGVLQLRRIR